MKPTVKLIGEDGNAFSIMARVQRAMKLLSRENKEYDYAKNFEAYKTEAMSGDYDNLLQTTMKYCEVK